MSASTGAVKQGLLSIARRWLALDEEMATLERIIVELTQQLVPALIIAFGFGHDAAAELLIVAGDNIDQVKSEPAWA